MAAPPPIRYLDLKGQPGPRGVHDVRGDGPRLPRLDGEHVEQPVQAVVHAKMGQAVEHGLARRVGLEPQPRDDVVQGQVVPGSRAMRTRPATPSRRRHTGGRAEAGRNTPRACHRPGTARTPRCRRAHAPGSAAPRGRPGSSVVRPRRRYQAPAVGRGAIIIRVAAGGTSSAHVQQRSTHLGQRPRGGVGAQEQILRDGECVAEKRRGGPQAQAGEPLVFLERFVERHGLRHDPPLDRHVAAVVDAGGVLERAVGRQNVAARVRRPVHGGGLGEQHAPPRLEGGNHGRARRHY